jgi:hypothetical protein
MMAAVALWLQPVLLAVLVLRVTGGAPEAPWLVLGALVAPLVALLAPTRAIRPNPVAAAAAAVAIVAVLGAGFVLAADAAMLLGHGPWHGVVLAAVVALLIPASPSGRRLVDAALVLAVVGLVLPLATLATATGTTPWMAWARGGQRSALTFAEASVWVREGERLARPARLTFADGQRVTVLTSGVFRVTERDVAEPTVREWRLGPGEALTLRPGDELAVAAGARLRFEAGRRVPGAPASAVAWADPPARGPAMLPAALGALATLVGGALALVPPAAPAGWRAAAGPLLVLAGVGAAAGWGLYAAATASDLVLGGSLPAPLLRLPGLALGSPAGRVLGLVAAGGLLLLLLAAIAALRQRFAETLRPHPALWLLTVVAAAALAVWPLDPWQLTLLGLGLAAAVWAPARLAGAGVAGVAGSLVGGVAFVGLAALPLAGPVPAGLEGLLGHPALVAMPLGWAAARGVAGATGGEAAAAPARSL